jgi:hypothetical protein
MAAHSTRQKNRACIINPKVSDLYGNAMQYEPLASRIIVVLERLHTVVVVAAVFGWELYHFITFIIQR